MRTAPPSSTSGREHVSFFEQVHDCDGSRDFRRKNASGIWESERALQCTKIPVSSFKPAFGNYNRCRYHRERTFLGLGYSYLLCTRPLRVTSYDLNQAKDGQRLAEKKARKLDCNKTNSILSLLLHDRFAAVSEAHQQRRYLRYGYAAERERLSRSVVSPQRQRRNEISLVVHSRL